MLNTKFIRIIIIILISFLIIFSYFYVNNKKQTQLNIEVSTSTQTVISDRVVFGKNETLGDKKLDDTSTLLKNNLDVNVVSYKDGVEDVEYNNLNKILFNWEITKNPELLSQALSLSESADNEVLLEAWRPFISKNSSELIKIINTSSDIKKTKANVYLIFQWYVELSGEYENLSSAKKQEITKQYNQLK